MQYYDIKNEHEINHTIREIKESHYNISEMVIPSNYENTLGGGSILTIYIKFEPVIKIEGEKDSLDTFSSRLMKEIEDSK